VQFVWEAQLGPKKDSLGTTPKSVSISSGDGSKEFAAEAVMIDDKRVAVATMVAAASHAIGSIDRLVMV